MTAHVQDVLSKGLASALVGTSYVAITPTPGTGVVGHAAPTTFDDEKPYITLYNQSERVILPTFLQLHNTVVSQGGARVQFTICVDEGNRRDSDGTAMTISNTNMAGDNQPNIAQAYIGAITASANTAAQRILGNYVFRGTIDVVEDVYELNFGGLGAGSQTGSRVATVMDASRTVVPIAVGPGQTLLVHQWAGSQSTGPTFEAVFGFLVV